MLDRVNESRDGKRQQAPPIDDAWLDKIAKGTQPEAIDHPEVKRACGYFGPKSRVRLAARTHNYAMVDLLMALGDKHPAYDDSGLAACLKDYARTKKGLLIQRRDALIRLAAWALANATELDDQITARRDDEGLDQRPVR